MIVRSHSTPLFRVTALGALALNVCVSGGVFSNRVQAAPASQALSFDVNARVTTVGSNGARGAAQNLNAKIVVAGDKARVETATLGRRSVLLYAPPTLYRLLPASKAGVRWNVAKSKASGFDPRQVLRQPTQIRSLLTRYGAKKIGYAKLGGVPVEGYELKKPIQTPGGTLKFARAWIRRSDALPLRFEAKTGDLNLNVSWSNYKRFNAASSLFAPPKGFAIRNSQTPPPQMLF